MEEQGHSLEKQILDQDNNRVILVKNRWTKEWRQTKPDIEHFFFECNRIYIFWKSVEQFINSKTEELVKIDLKSAIFGIAEDKIRKKDFEFVNHIILVAKMSISIAKKNE